MFLGHFQSCGSQDRSAWGHPSGKKGNSFVDLSVDTMLMAVFVLSIVSMGMIM